MGAARGADVVHDHHRIARCPPPAFNVLLRAVLLRLFAHQEARDRGAALLVAQRSYDGYDRVDSHREAPDGLGVRLEGLQKLQHRQT